MARLTTIQIHQRYETLPVDILRSHRAPPPPTLFRGGITQKPGKIYILSPRNERRIYLRVAFRTTRCETRSIRGFYLRNERFNRCFACGKHRARRIVYERGDGCRAIVISKLRRNEYTSMCVLCIGCRGIRFISER